MHRCKHAWKPLLSDKVRKEIRKMLSHEIFICDCKGCQYIKKVSYAENGSIDNEEISTS